MILLLSVKKKCLLEWEKGTFITDSNCDEGNETLPLPQLLNRETSHSEVSNNIHRDRSVGDTAAVSVYMKACWNWESKLEGQHLPED